MSSPLQKTARIGRLVNDTVAVLDLDLTGLTVLTEVGSGPYLLTPLIALIGGAKHVFAWTRDSAYGLADSIVADCIGLANQLGISVAELEFALNDRPPEHVAAADIITNSGFIRPIDASLLGNARKNRVVIPLMFEAWEWRDDDVDREYCAQHGILLGGTFENYEPLRIFDQCGLLAVKLLLEAGLEVVGNNIVIFSSDQFGPVVESALKCAGAEAATYSDPQAAYLDMADADALLLCDYHESRPFFGEGGIFDLARLTSIAKGLTVVHMMGDVDFELVHGSGFTVFPERQGRPRSMTYTLAYLGPRPVIQLQTAGLKVAECLYRGIDHPICQRII